MTHDELLAICDNYSFKDSAEPVKALRAVVELHKPIEKEERIVDGVNPAKVQVRICCQVCYDPRRYSYIEPYPCPTIKAIEKELQDTTHRVEPKLSTIDTTGTDVLE